MPTLEWIGKSKVVNHHQEVPFRVLERQYSFDEMGKHTEDNGSDKIHDRIALSGVDRFAADLFYSAHAASPPMNGIAP